MGHLTRLYATVILVCGTVAALDDPYIHLTKRLNNIERNVNANLEIFRTEMTVMFEIMNRINSSVFDLKEMFLNNIKHDPNDKHTEPVSMNASKGSSMSSRLPSSELSLQTHLMSIRNGFEAEKRARVKLTNDLDRILLSLKEHNSSVDAKLRNVERNLTDVVRTLAELKEENRISLTKMQEKLEAKQTSVEDTVRQLTDAKLRIVERNLTDVVRTHAELKEENRISLTKMQEKLEAKQTSVEDNVRQLIDTKLRIVERNLTDVVRTHAELKEENRISLTKMQEKLEAKQTSVEDNVRQLIDAKLRIVERNLTDVVRTHAELKEENRISLTKMQEKLEAKQTSVENNVRQLTDAKLRIVERNLTDVVRTHAELKEENRISLTKMQEKLEAKQTSVEDTVRQLIEDAATKKRICPAMFEKHGNSCYFAVPIEATWFNAKLICHLLDADLLKMDNLNEENVVAGVIKRSRANSYPYFWIDGSDLMIEGTFQWFRNNGQPEKHGFNGWNNGEPNGNTIENCLMIYNYYEKLMKWNDYDCDNRIPFVCEKELGEDDNLTLTLENM